MHKYVKEIIESIRNNPEEWKPVKTEYKFVGIKKDDIEVSGFGNTRPLSIIKVKFIERTVPCSYIDCWKLESAVLWWYRRCDIKTVAEA